MWEVFSKATMWSYLEQLDDKAFRRDGQIVAPGLLLRIAELLKALDCGTMWVETNALDEEYFREFLHFYATTLLEHPPTVTRLHFFQACEQAVRETLDATSPAVTSDDLKALGYLGYIVVRPTNPRTVGETLLHVPDSLRGEKCFVHCATSFGQTLNGRRLRVPSAPFIGQEQTGVCAHSAIWGAMKYLHKYRYYPKLSMPDIAVMATEGVVESRFTRPAEGLTAAAMYSVFKQSGFQIDLAEFEDWSPDGDSPFEAVYTAVESCLPALVGLEFWSESSQRLVGGHAVWVTGHTCIGAPRTTDPANLGRDASKLSFLSTAGWVGHLLVHDDNAGPYIPATISSSNKEDSALPPHYELHYDRYSDSAKWDASPHNNVRMVVVDVFAPLPEEVFVKAPDAKRTSMHAILGDHLDAICQDVLDGDVPPATAAFLAARNDLKSFAFRTFLCLSARYREHVVTSTMPDELKSFYAEHLRLPEYVWITEICVASAMGDAGEHVRRVVGEVIVDSTDSEVLLARNRPQYLALHVPGTAFLTSGAIAVEPWRSGDPIELVPMVVSAAEPYEPYSGGADPNDSPRSHRKLGPIRRS